MFETVVDAIQGVGDPAMLTSYLPADPDRRVDAILASVMDLEHARAMLEARTVRLLHDAVEAARPWVWPLADPDDLGAFDEVVRLVAHELAPALRLSPVTAGVRIRRAHEIVTRYPVTWAAWAAGDLDTGRVWAVTDACTNLTATECAKVEDLIHPAACEQTAAELRASLAKHVIAVAPDYAERARRRATRGRDVWREQHGDGTGALHASLAAADIAEIYALVDDLARQSTFPGDTRNMAQRRADAFAQLMTGHAPALGPEHDPDDPHSINHGSSPWGTRCECGHPCTHEPGHDEPSDSPGDEPGDSDIGGGPDGSPGGDGDGGDRPGDSSLGDGGHGDDRGPERQPSGSTPVDGAADPDDDETPSDITAIDAEPVEPSDRPGDRPVPEDGAPPLDRADDPAEPPAPGDGDEHDPAAGCWPDHSEQHARDTFLDEIDRRRAARARRIREQTRAFNAALARRRKRTPSWAVINPVTLPDGRTVQVGEVEDLGPVTAQYAQHLLDTGRARAPDPRPEGEPSPAQQARHDPPGWLDTWIRQRDGTCRAPGCRRNARSCDNDHTIPFPDGLTVEVNLGALCRTHHRTKGHWHVAQESGTAVLTWTSRHTGRTYRTTPRGATGDWTGAMTIT